MVIIPAIDIIDAKCVRLSQGDYDQKKIYNENPVEVAKEFEDAGIKRLHLVDLDGAKASHIVNYKVLEKIASSTNLVIDFGGGLKSDEDIRIAFESGAEMVTGGSIAVKSPDVFESWLQKYGFEKIILGADVSKGKIAVSGWQQDSGEELYPFIEKWMSKGARKVISTEISKDGMLQGPDVDLYKGLQAEFKELEVIASGGVSVIDDLHELAEINVAGVIVGKAIYENRISLKQLEAFL